MKEIKSKVMIFGTFDILHPGHIYYIKEAKKYADYVICIVARDVTVYKVKGQYPKNNENVRVRCLENTGLLDKVILGSHHDKHSVIRKYRPNILCLGYDQKFFIHGLKKKFPQIKIIRMSSYYPKKYKSSLIRR